MAAMVVHVEPVEQLPTVKLTLLAGFLGAGKTTLLNALVRAEHGVRVGVIVNDFGEINIDAELVASTDGDTVTLANGCICCTIRDDLLLTLFRLLHRDDAPEHVIIECSGVSDPAAVLRGFEEARLYDIVDIDAAVVVVDAEQMMTLEFRDEPLALHQLAVADLVVLNKVDLVDDDQIAAVKSRVLETVPGVRILESVRGNVDFDLLLGTGRFDPSKHLPEPADVHVHAATTEGGHAHEAHDTVYATWSFTSDRPLQPDRVRAALDALPVGVYRAKGLLYVQGEPNRRVVVQVVGRRVEVELGEYWGDAKKHSQFVTIGLRDGVDPEVLEASFRACEVEEAPGGVALLAKWVRSLWPTK
ncbi:MAG: CobW family GTP-binding protein [Nannocystaceae bacterium]|nr:GTP-binding protein [bacterium]